jgi:hypothetical protein
VLVLPLAARRASRTCLEGAMSFDDEGIDARTGASIRGSSMAALVEGNDVVAVARLFEVRAALNGLGLASPDIDSIGGDEAPSFQTSP